MKTRSLAPEAIKADLPQSKMLIVIPPCFQNPEIDFEIGFPTHLLLLGKVAREQNWSVEYLDMPLEEKDGYDSFEELHKRLNDNSIRLVGISNHTVRTSVTTKIVADRIKTTRPEIQVVVGGVNATFMWRELFAECRAIDFILRGYAQAGLRALLDSIQTGAPPTGPGLVSRCNGVIREEVMTGVTQGDLDMPTFDGFPVSRYLEWTTTYPLLTHTGCGFSCNFCTSVMPGPYQNREVHRPIEDVVTEMIRAVDLGFDRFFMSANVFTSRREHCIKLCQAIQSAGIPRKASWVCMTRVEFVDEELLDSMFAAGCKNIAFGIETANPGQWTSLRKGHFSEETIRAAFRLTKETGIDTTAFLMLGSPDQTQNDIEETIHFLRDLNPDYRVISFFQPFPGTQYWQHQSDFGLSELAPLELWNFHESPVCRTKHLSKKDLKNAAARLYLDRNQGITVDLENDSLEFPPYLDDTTFSSDYLRFLKQKSVTHPIGELLDDLERTFGSRARLITLYQLSAHIANKSISVQPVGLSGQQSQGIFAYECR